MQADTSKEAVDSMEAAVVSMKVDKNSKQAAESLEADTSKEVIDSTEADVDSMKADKTSKQAADSIEADTSKEAVDSMKAGARSSVRTVEAPWMVVKQEYEEDLKLDEALNQFERGRLPSPEIRERLKGAMRRRKELLIKCRLENEVDVTNAKEGSKGALLHECREWAKNELRYHELRVFASGSRAMTRAKTRPCWL